MVIANAGAYLRIGGVSINKRKIKLIRSQGNNVLINVNGREKEHHPGNVIAIDYREVTEPQVFSSVGELEEWVLVNTIQETGELLITGEESSYFPHRNSFGLVASISTRAKLTTVLIEYGYSDFANTIHLDSIPVGDTSAVRTAILPRTKPGLLQWRFVVSDSSGSTQGETQYINIHAGTKLVDIIYESPVLAGNTYYIDPSAEVNGTGTEASPFNTWASIANLGGNHTYLQKYGTVYDPDVAISNLRNVNGICKLGAYGDASLGRPRIIARGNFVRFLEVQYRIIIENIDFEGTYKDANDLFVGSGIRIRNGAGSVIYNCAFHGFGMGITTNPVSSVNGAFWSGVRVLKTDVYDCSLDGMYFDDTTEIEVGHCYIHRVNLAYAYDTNENFSSGDGIQISFTQMEATNQSLRLKIYNNTIDRRSHGNKFCLIFGAGGAGTISRDAYGEIIENEFFMHSTAGGVYMDLTNNTSLFVRNYFEGGTFGIHNRSVPGIDVYSNIFKGVGIGLSNVAGSARIHNNTFDDFNHGYSVTTGFSYNVLNNVFRSARAGANAVSGDVSTAISSNFNHFEVANVAMGYSSLALWQAAYGQDANSASGDPMFTDASNFDYTPAAGSPLADSGSQLSWADFDFAGNFFASSGAIDKGAIERNGSASFENEWYGVEFDQIASASTMTRIGRLGLHASLPIQRKMQRCILSASGVVQYYLNPSNSLLKADGAAAVLDGTDGQVMVEMPEFYYAVEADGNTRRIKISKYPITGFSVSGKMYLGAFEGAVKRSTSQLMSVINETADFRGGNNNAAWDAQPNSLLGKPATVINLTNFRAFARNNGAKWSARSYLSRAKMNMLYMIEYANRHVQAAYNEAMTAEGYKQGGLGDGVTAISSTNWNTFSGYYPFVPCGRTASLGNKSGFVNYVVAGFTGGDITVPVPTYRGVEQPYGHIWEWEDGILYNIQANDAGGQSQVFICDDPANYADVLTNYMQVGLLPRNEGYITRCLLDEGLTIPTEATGGSSTTRYSDYFYTSIPGSGSAIRGSLVSAAAFDGATAGLFFLFTIYVPASTFAYFGSRPCFIP
ncbi:MAG: hypothetical protein FD170_1421 [Bacteroidetes bacterium]|nr:MAG: hypothetical protein FD170_1421 [Bacteroidota bacterium]